MSGGKVAPFGAEPAGMLDLAADVAGGIAPPDPAITDAARLAAPLLASYDERYARAPINPRRVFERQGAY